MQHLLSFQDYRISVTVLLQMCTGFVLNSQNIGSGITETCQISVGVYYHQMNIQRFSCNFLYRFNNRETKRYIWYKNAIHDIEVKPVGLTSVYQSEHLFQDYQNQQLIVKEKQDDPFKIILSKYRNKMLTKICFQYSASGSKLNPFDRFFLYLPYSFARKSQLLSYLFQSVRMFHS